MLGLARNSSESHYEPEYGSFMNANVVLLLNLLSTWYLVGLIWMVQVVHYKMFDRVGKDQFAQYEQDHNRLITPIVAPPMLLELATACALLFYLPPGFPRWAAWTGVAMIALVWLATFFLSVPCHNKLLRGFDVEAYRMLVSTNWIRTLLWTARGVFMGYFAIRLFSLQNHVN
jgi:uncharacterized membrane protein